MAQPISTESIGEYIGSQIEDIEELSDFLNAIVNIVLNIIPFLTYKLLTT